MTWNSIWMNVSITLKLAVIFTKGFLENIGACVKNAKTEKSLFQSPLFSEMWTFCLVLFLRVYLDYS